MMQMYTMPPKACGPTRGSNRYTVSELKELARARGIALTKTSIRDGKKVRVAKVLMELCKELGLSTAAVVHTTAAPAPPSTANAISRMTIVQLRDILRARSVRPRNLWKLTKAELVQEVRKFQNNRPATKPTATKPTVTKPTATKPNVLSRLLTSKEIRKQLKAPTDYRHEEEIAYDLAMGSMKSVHKYYGPNATFLKKDTLRALLEASPNRQLELYYSSTGGWADWADNGGQIPRKSTLHLVVLPRDKARFARQDHEKILQDALRYYKTPGEYLIWTDKNDIEKIQRWDEVGTGANPGDVESPDDVDTIVWMR
jgi:hypothetical protein